MGIRKQVREILDRLPEDATWDDVMDEVVRQAEGGQRRERSRTERSREVRGRASSNEPRSWKRTDSV